VSLLCFIPARGGSKRIPRKNVRTLGDRPLLAYTIECALNAGVAAEIVVSSEDSEVLEVARRYGADPDERPLSLAGDRIRFVEVLEEYLNRESNRKRFETVCVLLPTCPFRTAADLKAAVQLHAGTPDSFVVSISAYEFPPEFACDFDNDTHALKLRQPEVYARSTQSQSVPAAHHPNGAIYVGSVARFLAERSFFAPPVSGYLMPPDRAMDLDHLHQWEIAESLLERQAEREP
jgi:CMP-N,N'-diacetyllegionaminic acid synthase